MGKDEEWMRVTDMVIRHPTWESAESGGRPTGELARHASRDAQSMFSGGGVLRMLVQCKYYCKTYCLVNQERPTIVKRIVW